LYRNNYAAFVELAMPLALLRALARPRTALGWSAAAALMAASVVACGSRMGTVLIVIETLVVLALDARGRALGAVWKLAAATTVLVAIAGPGFLWTRFQQADPLEVRRELVASSLAMARERPGMGFGLGTWPTAYPAYATFDPGVFANHAHCDWAEWAAEGGLPFLAATVALASAAVFWSSRRRWAIGVAAVFAHGLVDYPLQKPALAALTFTLLGALAARSSSKAQKWPAS
jgi:O-antigen ligase